VCAQGRHPGLSRQEYMPGQIELVYGAGLMALPLLRNCSGSYPTIPSALLELFQG
jgi:hypothetical protein